MTGGRYLFLIGGSLLAVSCAASQDLKVRPVGQSAVKPGPLGTLLAEARGQLALGNVGLALEAYHTLHRQDPDSPDPYEGMAECYEAMGRYDVARTNYEFALAYAPNSPTLLRRLAGTLDRLGEHEQATDVLAEAARLESRPLPAAPLARQATITPMAVPRAGTVTVKLVEAAPAVQPRPASAPSRTVSFPAPVVMPVARTASIPPAPPPPVRKTELRPAGAEMPPAEEVLSVTVPHRAPVHAAAAAAPLVAVPPIAVSAPVLRPGPVVAATAAPEEVVAVSIPRPATAVRSAAVPAVPVLAIAPLAVRPPAQADTSVVAAPPHPARVPPSIAPRAALVAARTGDTQWPAQPQPVPPREPVIAPPPREIAIAREPHLERTTRGEVLLVTRTQPVRVPRVAEPIKVAQTAPPVPAARVAIPIRQAAVRAPVNPAPPAYRPLQLAATQVRWVPLKGAPSGIELLNAARFEGLAARTRMALADRGWHRIAIGNARKVRLHSLVLYGSARAHLAKRLAAQFRCRAVKVGNMRSLIVLLGRDAMRRASPTAPA